MPRQARIKGNYYHIIVRGIGKQILFEDDTDKCFYLSLLRRYKEDTGITILAYCLMDNHVHLLVQDTDACLPLFMKKIGVSYAGYFNKKYERTGHLFQDRYKSETILSDTSLLTVYRYILKNPEKAGISTTTTYRWNSYCEYGKHGCLTDTTLLYELIGDEKRLHEYLNVTDNTEFMESDRMVHDDKWALSIISSILGETNAISIQKMGKTERDKVLTELRAKGISVRQLERLTGINRGTIQRVCDNRDGSC